MHDCDSRVGVSEDDSFCRLLDYAIACFPPFVFSFYFLLVPRICICFSFASTVRDHLEEHLGVVQAVDCAEFYERSAERACFFQHTSLLRDSRSRVW